MATALGIEVDWRPFVLDIPSYLGSAKLDHSGKVVEQTRSPDQWSGVKYAYFDCRRYANLTNLTVRGTVKIWDTNLAAIGMLWAKKDSDDVLDRYIDAIYEPFWKRELDIEDIDVIDTVLSNAGANTAGFSDYAKTQGQLDNEKLGVTAFAAGIFGVPTYIVNKQRYFGREHLPRIAWHMTGKTGPTPQVSYSIPLGQAKQIEQASDNVANNSVLGSKAVSDKVLDVFVDFSNPISYQAIDPVLQLSSETGCNISWYSVLKSPFKRPASNTQTGDRGARHRLIRAELLAQNITCYSAHSLPDIYTDFDRRYATMGLLWLEQESPENKNLYMRAVFARYWREHKPIDTANDIVAVLATFELNTNEFLAYLAGPAAIELEESLDRSSGRGIIGTPTFLIDDEPFLGLQHLPLLKHKLSL